MRKHAELVKLCISANKNFNEAAMTLDTHLDGYIAAEKITDENEAMFLRQVVYGLQRYKKLIKAFVDELYLRHASEVNREDMPVYGVLTYLLLIRLDELSWAEFKRFIAAYEDIKMACWSCSVPFLAFMFDLDGPVSTVVREKWMKLYDVEYVDNVLLATLAKYKPDADAHIQLLRDRVSGALQATAAAAAKAAPTVPVPFAITAPKPRLLPEPEAIVAGFKARPVPAAVYAEVDSTRQAVEAAKEANRQRLIAKYADPRYQPFRLRTDEIQSNLEKVKREVEAAREAELKFAPRAAKPVPQFAAATPIRMTAAAILREDALYKKKMEREATAIRAFETELRDTSSFDAWQQEMRRRDEEQRLEEVERRRQDAALAAELAIEARENQVVVNRAAAIELQEKIKEEIAKQQELREAELRAKQGLVEAVVETRENVKVAVSEVLEQRKAAAAKVMQERKELELEAAIRLEEERQRKEDLIRQIRAMEAVPVSKPATFDPTESSGIGLLNEMSIAELRERLAILKEREEVERAKKRQSILSEKVEKEVELQKKLENLAKFRALAEQEARQKKAKHVATRDLEMKAREEIRARQAAELNEQLAQRRAERKALAKSIRETAAATRKAQRMLAADKDALEVKKFADLQKGAEREIMVQQEVAKATALKQEAVKEKDAEQRRMLAEKAERERELFMKKYEERMKAGLEATQAAREAERSAKAELVERIKGEHTALRQTLAEAQPYAAAITDKIKTQARALGSSPPAPAAASAATKSSPGDALRKQLPPSRYPSGTGGGGGGAVAAASAALAALPGSKPAATADGTVKTTA